jgi:hypothetical protein
LARAFRQKLARVAMNLDHPWWVEDSNFDLEYHVRHIALPKPGDWRQLCIQAARLHSRPLDLTKPLWEMYVIEGLDNVEGLLPGELRRPHEDSPRGDRRRLRRLLPRDDARPSLLCALPAGLVRRAAGRLATRPAPGATASEGSRERRDGAGARPRARVLRDSAALRRPRVARRSRRAGSRHPGMIEDMARRLTPLGFLVKEEKYWKE